jgi:hypothetical protein
MTAPKPYELASHCGVAPMVKRADTDAYIECSIPAGISCSESADGFRVKRWTFWDLFFRRGAK